MVHEARHKRTGKDVAIKVIKRNDDMNDEESMATELEILKSVHHRYILNCLELFETPQCIWVVMEIIRGGELLDLLIEGGVYTERDAARAMKQAFLAISYLHSQGIVHRDLKLQNMLLTEKERTSDLKICDFGLSAQVQRVLLTALQRQLPQPPGV
jgi:serine/threonine protein kinase